MQQLKRPDVRAFVGATGSGKGVAIREHLARDKPQRLAVFDPMHEYHDLQGAVVVHGVADAIRAMQKQRFKVVWQPPDATDYKGKKFKAAFELFCEAVFALGEMYILVEELELVTSPYTSPVHWRNCTKRGRHRGLHVLAATQRPADADKAFWGSCSYIRCFALREQADKARMAAVLDCPIEQINALKTEAVSDSETRITYYERDFNASTCGEKTKNLRRKG